MTPELLFGVECALLEGVSNGTLVQLCLGPTPAQGVRERPCRARNEPRAAPGDTTGDKEQCLPLPPARPPMPAEILGSSQWQPQPGAALNPLVQP